MSLNIHNQGTENLENPEYRKKMRDEGGKFLTTHDNRRSVLVQSGLEFILSHFSEPLFSRTVMTKVTVDLRKGQREALDKNHAMTYFQGALWEDCRISAFRIGQQNPDLIFIDLDANKFASIRSFKLALTKTLKNIKQKLGGHPTVIWSGRGYHIIQPIECPEPLENIDKLKSLHREPSNEFLQWAKRYLSLGKADPSNNPALKSCLLRIPGSKNTKCEKFGIDPEVKILQSWNGHRPHYKLLFGRFYADLVGKKNQNHTYSNSLEPILFVKDGGQIPLQFAYIEKVLIEEQRPIDDYRKLTVDLILSRHLINVKRLDYEQAYEIIWQWLDKCNQLRCLEPSQSYFERYVVRRQLEAALQTKRLPMTEHTLQEKYLDLYRALS